MQPQRLINARVPESVKRPEYDVVLLSPPSRMVNHYRAPVALLYVGGYLRHAGLRIKIIDVPMRESVRTKSFYTSLLDTLQRIEDEMVVQFRALHTSIVGITCYTPEYLEVMNLARRLKAISPDVKVVVGGTHPTLYPESFFEEENRPVAFAVMGDGEVTMHELAQAVLAQAADFSRIKGIAYFDQETNQVVQTPPREVVADLDSISFPAYDLVDMDYYTTASPYAIKGVLLRAAHVMGGRGCPSQCTFCVAKKVRQSSGGGKYLRMRTASSLINEIRLLKEKYGIDAFLFLDDLFTLNKPGVMELCRLLQAQKMNLLWSCISKVTTVDEEMIKQMAAAGCIQIEFGVERGSDAALRLIKKGITVAKVIEVFDLCHKYGIRTYANMLVNLPEEEEKDLEDIETLLERLHSEVVAMNTFFPFPGTEIYDLWDQRFTREDLPLLSYAHPRYGDILARARFARHGVDLERWTRKNMRRFNKLLPHARFYLTPQYWRTLLRSRRKLSYLKGAQILFREFLLNKF
jgi:anaerobic magnesium-protoporphyrin IX monomethyl ester cyclase